MKTYNTYQEAKIANPKSEIYVWTGWKVNDELAGPAGSFAALGDKFVTADCWIKCHPADYCMTLDEFFGQGKKLVRDDVYLGRNGKVYSVGLSIPVSMANEAGHGDHNRYILHAKALEQAEFDTTPQQVESLAGGEWKNGDECKYMNSSVIYKFIGIDTDDLDCCWIKAPSGQLSMVGIHHLSSTAETPQQRQERDELEAAYELYCARCDAIEWENKYTFHEFQQEEDSFKGWIAVVRKTKYRKEAK